MNLSPTHISIRGAAIVLVVASFLGVAACSTTTSSDGVRARTTTVSRAPGTTYESSSQLEPAVMVQVPTDIDPAADPGNPVEVAQAFVTTLTNREPEDSDATWRHRWSKWATTTLSAPWGDGRGPNAYLAEVEGRHGLAVGMIIGSAVHDCDDAHCSVDIVADQTFILDGRVLNDANFVTWRLALRSEGGSWLVDAVSFGAGS
jgi:hypothetical protein